MKIKMLMKFLFQVALDLKKKKKKNVFSLTFQN